MVSTANGARVSARRGIARLAVTTLLSGVLLFAVAGTVRWTWGWAYLALIAMVLAAYGRTLIVVHPDLIDERQHPPADAKSWDKPFVAVVGVVGPIALLVLCGLDRRLGLTPQVGAPWHFGGLVLVAAGGALTNWAVIHNRFFSGLVRIQRDRGHFAVDSGPYAIVRHPGYVGSLFHTLGTSFALGSLWSLALSVPLVLVMVIRTAFEDRTLRAELEGYEAYARRVRFRLIPGIW